MNERQAGPPAAQETRSNQPVRIVPDTISIYYSNTVMVATSPVDICLYFGRYSQTRNENQEPVPAELYERQIYMTMDQAKRLAQVLNQTIQAVESGKPPTETRQPPPASSGQTGTGRPAPRPGGQPARTKSGTQGQAAPPTRPTKPS